MLHAYVPRKTCVECRWCGMYPFTRGEYAGLYSCAHLEVFHACAFPPYPYNIQRCHSGWIMKKEKTHVLS